MKASELRIGNYINVTGAQGKGAKQISIKKVNLHYLLQLQNKNKTISRIQLTEEWLVKFGFVNTNNNEYPNYILGNYKCMWRNKSTNICNNHGFIKDLKFVDELQNLYFSLTNKELTLNK